MKCRRCGKTAHEDSFFTQVTSTTGYCDMCCYMVEECITCEQYIDLKDAYRSDNDALCVKCYEENSVFVSELECDICNEHYPLSGIIYYDSEHAICCSCFRQMKPPESND